MFGKLTRIIRALVVIPAVGYCSAFSYLLIAQRAFIFIPSAPGPHTPAQYQVPYEEVSIPVGSEGLLAAWWVHHESPTTRPTVIYCHGNAGTLSMYANVARIFYNQGWNALLFDYRGYGNSSPISELSEESVAQDARQAYQWVLGKVEERRVIIWGHSLGGAIAARLAADHKPAGLILEGAFPSLLRMAQERFPLFPIHGFMLKDPFDTQRYLNNRSFPVLFMHAERDEIIPLTVGQELFTSASPPKQQLVIEGVGHNDFPSVHERYDRQIQAWVAAQMPQP